MTPEEEAAFERGQRAAWASVLSLAARELSGDERKLAALLSERERALEALRILARGLDLDVEIDPAMHLADNVEERADMTHYLDARERVFVAMQSLYSELYTRHLPPGVVLTYESPGGPVTGFEDEEKTLRALLMDTLRGCRYPGDGNRHERRKAAAERRRGR